MIWSIHTSVNLDFWPWICTIHYPKALIFPEIIYQEGLNPGLTVWPWACSAGSETSEGSTEKWIATLHHSVSLGRSQKHQHWRFCETSPWHQFRPGQRDQTLRDAPCARVTTRRPGLPGKSPRKNENMAFSRGAAQGNARAGF